MTTMKQENAMQKQVSFSVGTLLTVIFLSLAAFGGYYYYTTSQANKAQRITQLTTELNDAKAKIARLEAELNDLKRPNAIEAIQEIVVGQKQKEQRLAKIEATEKEKILITKKKDEIQQELTALK